MLQNVNIASSALQKIADARFEFILTDELVLM